MSRPTTKTDLIKSANDSFGTMWHLINHMPENMRMGKFNFPSSYDDKEAHWKRDKNIKDVLIHLYEWHQLLLKWVDNNQNNRPLPFIPAPYNWKTYGQMNLIFTQKHLDTPLDQAIDLVVASHKDVICMIEGLSNAELFAKGQFSWIQSATLGSYCVSATASHYDWAIKKIRLHIKTFEG